MTNKNFTLIVAIIVIGFLLYTMNTNITDVNEGYDNDRKHSTVETVAGRERALSVPDATMDNVATQLNSTTTKNNIKLAQTPQSDVTLDTTDVFNDSNGTGDVDIPQPMVTESSAARVMDNNFDNMNLTNDLGSLIKSGKVLTSDHLLPEDDELNEHNQFKVPTTYMDSNLAANGVDKFGVDTIGGSKRNASQDIRGNIPCPKINVGPFHNSTIDPDYNLKGLSQC